MGKRLDITGKKFGKLTAIKISDRKKNDGGLYWDFICDCGNQHITCASKAKKSTTIGCKACNEARFITSRRTHGKSGGKSKAYLAWKRIKNRCCNKKDGDYAVYSLLGIDPLYIDNPTTFMEDIGEPPNDGKRYSVDRKDNSIGYFKGNIRWANDHQQAANQGIRKDNKTGVTGITIIEAKTDKQNKKYLACWYDIKTSKPKSISFNVGKLGEELAFFMACECRELMIQRMNDLGTQYTPTHGL